MARAGWLFSRHGMVLSKLGVHTCFIRYYRRILGSRLAVDCFVTFFIFYFFKFYYLNQLSSERGRVFPFRCPDAGVGRDLPGGRVLMMG